MVTADDHLPHLHPAVQATARLSASERIDQIRADRWIGYPKAVEAVDRLQTPLGWPRKQRMPNLLLIGPTNNGKSMIIERFRRQHLPRTGPDREHIPVVCVQMPAEPTVVICPLRCTPTNRSGGQVMCGSHRFEAAFCDRSLAYRIYCLRQFRRG